MSTAHPVLHSGSKTSLSESVTEKPMAAALSCLCWLLVITFAGFFFFNYQLMSLHFPKDVQGSEISQDDTAMLTKFRVLLGMRTFRSKRPKPDKSVHSPAQAPTLSVSAPVPAPLPLFRAHVESQHPPHHWHSIAPARRPSHETENGDGTRNRRLAVIVGASVGAALVVVAACLCGVMACKRLGRAREKRSERRMLLSSRRPKFQLPASVTNKISSEPGPELFYMNALTPYLESDLSLKQTSETKSVSSNGSISYVESDLSTKQASKYRNVSLKEGPRNSEIENPDSDSESFHSVCCSHSSIQSVSDASEENLGILSANCSPSSLSYRSVSPRETVHALPFARQSISGSQSRCCENETSRSSSKFSSTPHFASVELSNAAMSASEPKPSLLDTGSLLSSSTSKLAHKSSMPPTETGHIPKPPLPPPPPPPPPPPLPPLQPFKPPSQSSLPFKLPAPPLPPTRPPLPPLPPPRTPAKSSNECGPSRPPPPPPSPPQSARPVGKDGSPLPKLKPLHWVKVRATPDRSMVWDRIRSNSFEFDEKMIESLFGYNSQCSSKPEEARHKNPSPGKNNIMEHKRLQNITILMKALNASTEQVFDALMQGRGLSVQQLEALVKMAPTKEEEEKLSKYEGDTNNLDPAERFLEMVLRIPYAFARSEVMLYKETFEDEVSHLRKSFEMLEEACKELRSSRLFLRLLEAVLKTGNRMNVGTIRGGARAFKLDALLKLADVKGTDGKTTLLHFVVQEMIRSEGAKALETTEHQPTERENSRTSEEKEDDYRATGLNLMSGLSNELCNVKRTATVDLDVLISSVSYLSDGLSQSKHLVQELSMDNDQNNNFAQTMKSFIDDAETVIRELKGDEEQVLLHVREITEYYHGDVSREEQNPLRIFIIVRDFLGMLDQACKEVRASKTPPGAFPVVPFR